MKKELMIKVVKTLKEEGFSNIEIADRLGLKGDSTVRSLNKENQ